MIITLCEDPVTLCEDPVTLCEDPVTLCEDPVTLCEDPVTLCEERALPYRLGVTIAAPPPSASIGAAARPPSSLPRRTLGGGFSHIMGDATPATSAADLPLLNGRIDAIAIVGLLYESKSREAASKTLSRIRRSGAGALVLGSQANASNVKVPVIDKPGQLHALFSALTAKHQLALQRNHQDLLRAALAHLLKQGRDGGAEQGLVEASAEGGTQQTSLPEAPGLVSGGTDATVR